MTLSLPRSSRGVRAAATGAVAVASAAALIIAGASGASAAKTPPKGWIAAPNGMVGVPENVTIFAPSAIGQTVTVGFQLGAAASQAQTTIASSGYGNVMFTPTGAGTWTVNGLGSIISAGSDNFAVAAAPTYTLLLAQNSITSGQNNTLSAAVVAPLSTLEPQGSVYLSTANGNGITTAPITGTYGTGNIGVANLNWNPGFTGQTPIQAQYLPASAGQVTSTSVISSPNITTAINPVSLRFPAVLYAGTPTVLQGVLGFGYNDGSVAFYLDGNGISPSVPTVNGVGTFQWTPQVSGNHQITVAYTSKQLPNGSYQSGTSPQPVNIQGPRGTDNITVDPPGQPAWSIAAPIVMTAGTSITLAGTSQSGTPVIFSETGPCVISGAQLQALSAGTCQVVAQSPGNATYSPGSEPYSVTVNAAPTKPRRPRN
mgnify:CR=1 FL=1